MGQASVAVRNVVVAQPHRDKGGSETWPPGSHTRAGKLRQPPRARLGGGGRAAGWAKGGLAAPGARAGPGGHPGPRLGLGGLGSARGDIFREGQGLPALGLSGQAGPGAGSWAFPVDAESLLLGKSLPSGMCLMVR